RGPYPRGRACGHDRRASVRPRQHRGRVPARDGDRGPRGVSPVRHTEGVVEPSDAPDAAVTVGTAASRAGVTVRTLHHWDEIGLARPSERSPAGYRLYTASDLARLHRVVIHRELGVSLEETARLLEAPAEEAAEALLRQRDRVRE